MEIRFAKPGDLKQCLTLDWSYETEYVWQMQSEDSGSRIEVTFRSMRLPRAVTVNAPPDPQHVKENWERQECFLVVEHQGQVLGFVDLTTQNWQQAGWINHLAVAREYRGRGIGRSLMNAALGRRAETARVDAGDAAQELPRHPVIPATRLQVLRLQRPILSKRGYCAFFCVPPALRGE